MHKRIAILLSLLFIVVAVWLQITSVSGIRIFISRLNDISYDLQLRTRILTHPLPPHSPVVIVDIDDKSLEVVGRWPWPRDKLATLLNNLKNEGAVVVALDMMFSEKEINIAESISQKLTQENLVSPQIETLFNKLIPQYNYDLVFAKSLSEQDVVLGMTFLPRPLKSGVLPPPLLTLKTQEQKALNFIKQPGYIGNIEVLQQAAKNAGFINVYPDFDGIIRRVPLVIRYQDNLYPSLALAAVKLYLLENVTLGTAIYNHNLQIESIQLGDHGIPVDAYGEMIVPFRGKSFTFPYFSALDVLQNTLPANSLAGKIVFIGTSATGIGDLRATAVQAVFPGVEVQATIADAILTNHFFYKPEWTTGAEVFITILIGLLGALLFPFLGPRTIVPLIILIPILLIFGNNFLWEQSGLILFMLIPVILTLAQGFFNIIFGYLFETRRREKLKAMFGQYVPEKHIDEMLYASGSYALHGEDREMTVLFADIRNFTTISEPMTASELKDMLNAFFTPMTEIIFRFQGTIDKYIGDLIMAFWGAPLRDKRHAEHAILAALDMQKAVKKLKPLFAEKGWSELEIGIGINTGVMSVGDMGSTFRRNYTVLGDAVNLASRIEGLSKFYGVKILLSEFTERNQKKFLFRKLDRVLVKGKKNGVEIYEVVARLLDANDEIKQEVSLSNDAIAFYFQQQWANAKKIFLQLIAAHPDSRFYALMLNRIDKFEKEPPPPDWDGVFIHVNK